MTNETTINPLQLVPHRIKALKLIYETYNGATTADDHSTGDMPSRREQSDALTTRYSNVCVGTKRTNSADLQ